MRHLIRACAIISIALSAVSCVNKERSAMPAFRPPSVPLIAHDPYFSVWSNADKLTDDVTRHWTREPMSMTGVVRVDGQPRRVIGDSPKNVPAMNQTSTRVLPTRTICTFESPEVRLTLTFLTPALPDDLDLLSTPITYVLWNVQSNDGKSHDVTIDFTADASFARHESKQAVVASKTSDASVPMAKIGTKDQPVLKRTGDRTRIDWGYLCL